MVISAWIFDVYPTEQGIAVWLIDREGIKYPCLNNFIPSFFLQLSNSQLQQIESLGSRCPVPVSFKKTERTDLFTGWSLDVLQVFVHDPLRFKDTVKFFERFFPPFAFFNSDILPEQLFLYETDLFPLAWGEFTITNPPSPAGTPPEEGTKCHRIYELLEWKLNDSRDAVEYKIPPFSMMTFRYSNDFVPAKYQRFIQLEICYDGKTYVPEYETPVELLEEINRHLRNHDPDILLTEYGDSILLPKLTELARKHKYPLLLNRDVSAGYKLSKESSFFQYGKIVHKDGAFQLRGRWHIDIDNSFTIVESDIEGLFEIIRVTQLCPQHQARASIGTGLSSLQLSWAYRNNVLIPAKKREPEEFKSASTLLLSDRGGLIYMPPTGYHENIAELDFVSMYPNIMVNHNVSPETINCQCCPPVGDDICAVPHSALRTSHSALLVPELNYTICQKREGIVPATLRSIIAKRAYYKNKKKEFKNKNERLFRIYDGRQNALKWMLVSCFGYLGYKNARFGRIEAHESVNAFSREAILTAKEVAESQGFHLVHAIIDCMWLKKEGATENDYLQLCSDIREKVGIDISLEGIYKWILFPASKMDSQIATGNRYAGLYTDGEMKLRGIETRRHDMPKLLKKMQGEMLEKMSAVDTVAAIHELPLLEIVRNYVSLLQSGRANPMDLVIRRNTNKEASEYMNNSISACVTKLLEKSGVHIAAGEAIEFIIINQSGKARHPSPLYERGERGGFNRSSRSLSSKYHSEDIKAKPLSLYSFEDGYDIPKYTELLLKAAETLLQPLGYDYEKLTELFNPKDKASRKTHKKNTSLTFEFS